MARDRYKYFRIETREALEQLSQGVLDLEKGMSTPDAVARLLRLAHMLKGAARVVKRPEIADRAHAVEDALSSFRDSSAPITRDRIDLLLRLLDDIGDRVAALKDPASSEPTEPARSRFDEPLLGFRPAMDDMDALLGGVAEAHVQLSTLRPRLEQVERARRVVDLLVDQLASPREPDASHPSDRLTFEKVRSLAGEARGMFGALERHLTYGVDQIDRELRQVRDAAERLRLAPAGALFTFLERAVRDVALAQGKHVVFEGQGAHVRVDSFVLDVVQGALLQVVRNAVAHGIEARDSERQAAGKPPQGRVILQVVQRGKWVSFVCTDDGRGIDLNAVQRLLERKGIRVGGSETMEPDELLRALLKGGISTSASVTDVSGRGVGLDIVREAAERLGGEVTVRTTAGTGTTVELVVPLSITSFQTLVVEAPGGKAAIPLDAVRGTMRVTREEIVRTEEGDSILFDGLGISFGSLPSLVSSTPSPVRPSRFSSVVIVQGKTGVTALSVDRILGTASVVMRPLPDLAPAAGIVAGAWLDAVGDPQLVLDPDSLVAERRRIGPVQVEDVPPRPSVLVIDDSLTTRMLEQSILESAGYDVELAISGEEALDKARRARFDLFLVDVEMPGMDGFTFIERARADPNLRSIPSILVTSRTSPEDRQRGQEVGARVYIIKTDFDQGVLLEHIRTLVG